jgi:cob(I)alamin adenosyltransferase
VPKDDARTEAYGTIDEAVSCLGLARAEIGVLVAAEALPEALADLGPALLQTQRDLFVAGAELAANPDAWDRLVDGQTRVDEAMLERLESRLAGAESMVEMPREFTVPGADRLSASLELARAVIRRAERRVISLDREGLVPGAWLVPWLNRLADLLWVYARLVESTGLGSTVTVRT